LVFCGGCGCLVCFGDVLGWGVVWLRGVFVVLGLFLGGDGKVCTGPQPVVGGVKRTGRGAVGCAHCSPHSQGTHMPSRKWRIEKIAARRRGAPVRLTEGGIRLIGEILDGAFKNNFERGAPEERKKSSAGTAS